VAARVPVVLQPVVGVTAGERVDGLALVVDDTVLLTTQLDPRENGLFRVGRGRYIAMSSMYVGMQVLVLQGNLCSGWMFVCAAMDATTGANAFRPVFAPGPQQSPDATEGRLMPVSQGSRLRTLTVRGWRDVLRTVERPDALIVALSQSHTVRPSDVLATTGTWRVTRVPSPGVPGAWILAIAAHAEVDGTAAAAGDILAPLYALATSDDPLGVELQLAVVLTDDVSSSSASSEEAMCVGGTVGVRFAGESPELPRDGTIDLSSLEPGVTALLRATPSPSTASPHRSLLGDELLYWPPPPLHQPMQLMTLHVEVAAPHRPVALLGIFVGVRALEVASPPAR
jgi:hypothetical protein